MDFGFSDEHRALQEVAKEFVERHCPAPQAKEWDEAGAYPAELFTAIAEMGWIGLPFPAEAGGDDGSPMELAIIAEQLGTASLDIAMCFIGSLIPALTVYKWGTDAQREAIKTTMIPGRSRFAVAISEPDTGSDAAALRCSAKDAGDHFVLNGEKMWCTGAGLPGTDIMMYVRTAKGERKHDGISIVVVNADTPGVELRKAPTLARHILGTYEVFLKDVVVPKENLVGELNQGWTVMLSNLELERVLMSGGYVGVAQATLDEALAYSKQRNAFGRPIGNFQSLAHAMADMQVEIDSARLLAYRAAWMLSQGLPCSREGAMAKLKGSET
ncbi:acyl-CoA dehydrogenase, partial [Mycobacterium colombiense]|uniref:acyl-CoA dehydrogenase family protein n=1 Tax=Mycobacterium colombiense TaxID=339268 RepID=UPI0007EFC071